MLNADVRVRGPQCKAPYDGAPFNFSFVPGPHLVPLVEWGWNLVLIFIAPVLGNKIFVRHLFRSQSARVLVTTLHFPDQSGRGYIPYYHSRMEHWYQPRTVRFSEHP